MVFIFLSLFNSIIFLLIIVLRRQKIISEPKLFKHLLLSYSMNKSQLLQSLKQRGFSKEILNAFLKVKRESFVPEKIRTHAYEDTALPIGRGQTISQPYTIAMMLSLLKLKEGQKVLEAGSGCGYVLALISEIVGSRGRVFGIEIIKELVENSRKNLKNYKNIKVYNKNGTDGLSKEEIATFVGGNEKRRRSGIRGKSARETAGSLAFDRILISAACEKIPEKLLSQLKDKGIIVAPVGLYEQSLVAVQKKKNKFIIKEKIPGFVFVPFISD